MKIQEVWFDGICNICGNKVFETTLEETDIKEEAIYGDYKNACSNENCKENYWHYVRDQEFLTYYEHTK